MKHFTPLFLFFLVSFSSIAQESEDEYELQGNERAGYIIDKNDIKHEGIVKLSSRDTPWINQKFVRFIALDNIDNSKKRQKFKKMNASDIKEYVAYDGNIRRHFEIVKYTNLKEAADVSNGGISGSWKAIKNLSTRTHLAEKLLDGKLSVYVMYGYPTQVAIGETQVKNMDEEIERLANYPTFIYSKNNDKLKEFRHKDLEEIIGDCKEVKDKLANREYLTIMYTDKEKKSMIGKFIRNEIQDALANKLAIISEVFADYNTFCK